MHSKQMIVALAALSTVATAAPANPRAASGAFSVGQVATGRKARNGPAAYAAALAKYGAAVPEGVKGAMVDAAGQGSVTATPQQYDSEYLCPVGVGSQTLNLDFDTGSSDLWVFSTELPAADDGSHTLYSCTGTQKSGYTWSISYGDGSGASGNVFADKVTVGGVTATAQAVEAATSISTEFVQGAGDGLLGLAFSSINTVKPQSQLTFFDSVKSSLSSPLFAVTLKHQAPGTYDFGYIDSSKYTGSLAYASVDNSQGFWSFTTGGYSVGNTTSSSGFAAIADTGTSLMLLPDAVVAAYYKQVPGSASGSGGYTVPCSATLPAFSVSISGYKATVPGSYMNYAPNGGSSCYGGIQSNSGIGFSILGDVFLKSQYVVFDSNGPRLGFAKQA